MQLTRFTDIALFAERAEPFLLLNETAHCLQLGLCTALLRQTGEYAAPPYLATVSVDGTVAAVAMRTPPYNVALSLIPEPAHAAPATALFARDLLVVYGPQLRGVLGPAAISRAFAAEWHTTSGQPAHLGLNERVFQLSTVRPVSGVPGRLRRAAPADRDLLIRWNEAFAAEAMAERSSPDLPAMVDRMLGFGERGAYLWDESGPVSLACYTGPTPHGMRIGPVYTPPELRGHGYASACVAGLSQALLDEGRTYTFLFTNLANPTSNHIYQQIGYTPVCDMDEYRFGELG